MLLALALLQTFSQVQPGVAPQKIAIGLNASAPGNNSTELPFLDYMKLTGPATVNYAPADPALFDADGWPVRMGAGPFTYVVPVGDGPIDLVMLYDGSPAVSVYDPKANAGNAFGWNGMQVARMTRGRVVFRSPAGGSVNLSITHLDPAAPMRNIRIVRADREKLLAAGEIINPDFADLVRHFAAFRTMDWDGTNGGQIVSPEQRTRLSSAAWGSVPIEAKVALANKAKVDLWLTIPAHANDAFVAAEVGYVRDHLDPALKLDLEFSNEVWNDSFEQSKYAAARGKALWGDLPWVGQVWYGYRAAQVMAIARRLYGTDATRLNGVLATFGPWTGPEVFKAAVDGVARARLGKPSDLFRLYAMATYFAFDLGFYPGNEADRPILLAWAKSGAAGVDKAFQQIEHGGLLTANGSLDAVKPTYAIQAARAKSIGLELVAYEGGPAWTYFPSTDSATFDTFFNAILADPRMATITRRSVTDFARAGGTLDVHYNDVGAASKWGPWGLIPKLGVKTPRYDALMEMSGK